MEEVKQNPACEWCNQKESTKHITTLTGTELEACGDCQKKYNHLIAEPTPEPKKKKAKK